MPCCFLRVPHVNAVVINLCAVYQRQPRNVKRVLASLAFRATCLPPLSTGYADAVEACRVRRHCGGPTRIHKAIGGIANHRPTEPDTERRLTYQLTFEEAGWRTHTPSRRPFSWVQMRDFCSVPTSARADQDRCAASFCAISPFAQPKILKRPYFWTPRPQLQIGTPARAPMLNVWARG